jgi:hypothetical protein
MSQRVNIVTACSGRKRTVAEAPILLRTVPTGSLQQRIDHWRSLLDRANSRYPAQNLYIGEHWSVAKQIPERGPELGFKPNLWVCSAGYGLIHSASEIVPYGATFSLGHPDSVDRPTGPMSGRSEAKAWWLASCCRNQAGGLAALAAEHPKTPLMVALSSTYLHAVVDDLREASRQLRSPDLLMIIAAGCDHAPEGLESSFLPTGAEFSHVVGGTLGSLNIRLALEALRWASKGSLDAGYLRDRFQQRLSRLPAFARPERHPLSDDEVEEFIERNAATASSHTAMLRHLRESGFACEQARFRELYVATVRRQKKARGLVS